MESPRPLHVGIVTPTAQVRGGAELMLLQVVEHGRASGVAWTIACLEDGPLVERLRALGVDVIVVEAGRVRRIGAYVRTVRALVAEFRARRVDLVLGWQAKAQLYGAPVGRALGIPVVWFQHGMPTPASPSRIDRVATWLPATRVLACSEAVAQAQRALRPSRRVEVVYPPVDVARFEAARRGTAAERRARVGLPAAGPIVGIVGRLQRWKGMHVFVDAMADVLRHHPDALGVIVGGAHDLDPDYPAELARHVAASGLADRVRLVGYQPNAPEWMAAFDIAVHASDAEPFGMVIVEAMALGRPVVATAAGGVPEIVADGETGLLVPFGDAAALARAIRRLLDDAPFADALAAHGLVRARDFAVERCVARLVTVLGDSLGDAVSMERI